MTDYEKLEEPLRDNCDSCGSHFPPTSLGFCRLCGARFSRQQSEDFQGFMDRDME